MDRLRTYLGAVPNFEAFSAKAGIELRRLREIESGAEPSMFELRQLSDALRIPITTLVSSAPENRAHVLFRGAPTNGENVSALSVDLLSDKLDASLGMLA
jgi:transcriptional regulator with XRE-family HTH domain